MKYGFLSTYFMFLFCNKLSDVNKMSISHENTPLVIMVGDKEFSNNCSDRLPVKPSPLESSSAKIVQESVWRCIKVIPQVERMVQPLISGVVKKMSSNLARMKRDQDEPCEEDWGQETYSNTSIYVLYDE